MQRTKYVSAYLQWISNDKGFCCWRELSMCDPSVYWFQSALLNPFTILIKKVFNIKKTDVLLCFIQIRVIWICKDSFLSKLKTNIPTNANCWFPVNDRFVNINKRRIFFQFEHLKLRMNSWDIIFGFFTIYSKFIIVVLRFIIKYQICALCFSLQNTARAVCVVFLLYFFSSQYTCVWNIEKENMLYVYSSFTGDWQCIYCCTRMLSYLLIVLTINIYDLKSSRQSIHSLWYQK